MSAGTLITGKLGCIAKVDISATLTAFSDQVSVTLDVADPDIIEVVSSSANATWKGRDVDALSWGATIRIHHPSTEDAAAGEVRSAALAGTSDTFSFTVPHSTPSVFTGTAFVKQTITAEPGGYLFDEYQLFGDCALVES